ncbi:hypothetical protein EVAR_39904_1 [Eumeta japonica]|uniref:Uncharacterized protein n=1 Tax=Eumeta variegata TaxID=151549 RepID=A0A4C1WQP9_EUMVA|nr:hypothetical protein EVAR_39904_1 [Eumeta japonica]
MSRFSAPRPFPLLFRVPILRHCDACVANFTVAEFRFFVMGSRMEPTSRLWLMTSSIDIKDERIHSMFTQAEPPAEANILNIYNEVYEKVFIANFRVVIERRAARGFESSFLLHLAAGVCKIKLKARRCGASAGGGAAPRWRWVRGVPAQCASPARAPFERTASSGDPVSQEPGQQHRRPSFAPARQRRKVTETATEEVTSTETPKESPVKKSPAKKAESNGATENGAEDAAPADGDEPAPAENGDAEDSNDATENGDDADDAAEKKEVGVKRKSTAGDGEVTDKTTPEKKAKVADEAPADADEVAA